MSVQRNVLRGGLRATRDPSGVRIETGALIDDLGGEGEAKILAALTHPDLPAFGSPYPGRGDLALLEVEAELLDTGNAAVRLIYRVPGPGDNVTGAAQDQIISIDIDATTTTETTTHDGAGQLMRNHYRGWPTINGSIIPAQWESTTIVEATVFRPQLSARIVQDRRARPLDLARRFVGTTNRDTWSGDAPGTWLCTGITASLAAGAWRTTFQFAYRPETWRLIDVMEIHGFFPEDASVGNGIAQFDVYRSELWRDLGVTL